MSQATPALEARQVTRSLPLGSGIVEILRGISFAVRRLEFVALMGPSGSGKSTLLGVIAGLDQPTSGHVLVDGTDITTMPESRLAAVRNAKIGMVFQAYNLIPTLSAQENVEVPLYAGHHPGSPAARAREMLELVGLGHRAAHRQAPDPARQRPGSDPLGRRTDDRLAERLPPAAAALRPAGRGPGRLGHVRGLRDLLPPAA